MSRRQLGLDRPREYEIRVQGQVDHGWADWYDDMVIRTQEEADGSVVTTLTGVVADQAALLGLLSKLYHHGLPLLEVRQTGSGCTADPGSE